MRFFFYGTLKEGFRLHRSLGLGPKIEDFLLKDHRIYDLGGCPCITPERGFDTLGEIHDVTDKEKSDAIDRIELSAGYKRGTALDSGGQEVIFYYFARAPKWGRACQGSSWPDAGSHY